MQTAVTVPFVWEVAEDRTGRPAVHGAVKSRDTRGSGSVQVVSIPWTVLGARCKSGRVPWHELCGLTQRQHGIFFRARQQQHGPRPRVYVSGRGAGRRGAG
ncbi:unnamed protein product, partial [Ectocarpus sp. 8 AP-2014]